MVESKNWSQRPRSIDECMKVLHSLDERTLARRAGRLSLEGQIELSCKFYMPSWTWQLLDEAGSCFTNGEYNGCILVLAAAVEHGLREMLGTTRNAKLNALIREGVRQGYITQDEVSILHLLRTYRNDSIHCDIDSLASGKKLRMRRSNATESGFDDSSEWEEIELTHQTFKETAASLSAEHEVREIYLAVSQALLDIFDRCPTDFSQNT